MRLIRMNVFRSPYKSSAYNGISTTESELYMVHPKGKKYTEDELKNINPKALFFNDSFNNEGYLKIAEHNGKKTAAFGGNIAVVNVVDLILVPELSNKFFNIHDNHKKS